MDSYVSELEKQNEELKQLLSDCQHKVAHFAGKVAMWYDVKVVDRGGTSQFFTESYLEQVVFKIRFPKFDALSDSDINKTGRYIYVKCYSGSELVWNYELRWRKSTDTFGREKQDWYVTFDVSRNGFASSNRIFKTYADFTADLDRYALRLKERRERLHQRA